MQEALEIKNEFYKKFVDKYGLGLLEPDMENDNGILFLVYFLMLCEKAGVFDDVDQIKFLTVHDSIKVRDGEYIRHPLMKDKSEAHDNMVAVVVGAVMCKEFHIIERICDHMEKTGGVSDHRTGSKWVLEHMRQGSEIAFYQICCGRIPSILDMAWLCGGIIVNILKGNPSSKNLGWARIYGMKKAGYGHLPFQYGVSLDMAILTWELILKFKYKSIMYFFERYFKQFHPIIKMQRLLNEQGLD
jgi:hypothetical protein